MDTNQALTLILSNLRQVYNHLNSIMNATKDLIHLSSGEDVESCGVILNMREKSMQQIDQLNGANAEILSKLPAQLRHQIGECLRPTGAPMTLDNPLQTNIFDTGKRNGQLLKRIVDADEELNKKVSVLRG